MIKSKIEIHRHIDKVLRELDSFATKSLNSGRTVTVQWSDDAVTNKQINSMHLWCRWCETYLNSIKAYRPGITVTEVPWIEGDFQQLVYKPLLKGWKGKKSTKDQTTKDPEDIRLAISSHLATHYEKDICLPEWPSALNPDDRGPYAKKPI